MTDPNTCSWLVLVTGAFGYVMGSYRTRRRILEEIDRQLDTARAVNDQDRP